MSERPPASELVSLYGAILSYQGITTANGDPLGVTLICAGLANEPSYAGQFVKMLDGGAAGQMRYITTHVGNTLTVDSAFTNSTPAVQQIIAGLSFAIISTANMVGLLTAIGLVIPPPGNVVNEDWQTETIDLNIWTPTHPATNPLIVVTDAVPYQAMHVVRFDVQNAENGHLIGCVNRNRWRVYPGIISSHLAIQKLVMEFELYHNDVAHINQATSFFGLVADPAAFIRTSPNIVGFRYDGADQLMSITDDAGTELSIGIVEVIEDIWHKFKIEVVEGEIRFYVDDVLRTTHADPLVLPDRLMYPSWYFASLGGGADTFETYLGAVRIGYEVVIP